MTRAFSVALALLFSAQGLITRAQDTAQMAAGLESLPHGFYRQTSGGWEKMELVTQSGIGTTHGASALAGVPPGSVYDYAGSEAVFQSGNRRPVFGIKLDPSHAETPGRGVHDLVIVRMSKKKDHRELEIMRGGFASVKMGINPRDVVAGTLTAVTDQIYTVVPKEDLKQGEYLVTFPAAYGTAGYDFGVK
jgi:hypothetical protein